MLTSADSVIALVSETILPFGLVLIMFSLGLSVSLLDLRRLLKYPKAIVVGVGAQVILLPVIAFILATYAGLDDVLALSLIVISACPGGITSNALTFYGRADVPLSILITAVSSLTTVFTAPIIISIGLSRFPNAFYGELPNLAGLTGYLFLYSTTPFLFGMVARLAWPVVSAGMVRVLRPATLGILLTIIAFSILVNRQIVMQNIFEIAPIAFVLNIIGMGIGWSLGRHFRLRQQQCRTLSVEVGVQNVTMATFIGMSVLNHPALAALPTIYGIIMVINALIFLLIWARPREEMGEPIR